MGHQRGKRELRGEFGASGTCSGTLRKWRLKLRFDGAVHPDELKKGWLNAEQFLSSNCLEFLQVI